MMIFNLNVTKLQTNQKVYKNQIFKNFILFSQQARFFESCNNVHGLFNCIYNRNINEILIKKQNIIQRFPKPSKSWTYYEPNIEDLVENFKKEKTSTKNELMRESFQQQKKNILLLKKGLALGHKSSKLVKRRSLHPSMSKFSVGSHNTIKLLNNEMFLIFFLRALYVLKLIALKKGEIWIVNTQPDFTSLVQNRISSLKKNNPIVSSINSKWVGGTLTNWREISKVVTSFAQFSTQYNKFLHENNIVFSRYEKLKKAYQGFLFLDTTALEQINYKRKKPAIIFIINPNDNRYVINEAVKLDIPIIALTNSITNLTGITYPIPLNNCSFDGLHLCLDWISRVLTQRT